MHIQQTISWASTTNIYEVNIRQYTEEGTFNAFAKELPRLKKMGVHTLWLMPITLISQKNKKGSLGSPYATADYTTINPEFGTLGEFQRLVHQVHRLGMKIIIDWVANHTGWDHVWTKEHPEFYKKSKEGDFLTPAGMEDIIELDFSITQTQIHMIKAMNFWIEIADIDGFRCDLASWVTLEFWKKAKSNLNELKPLFWLGEYDALDHPDYEQVFDASYSWKWMHLTEQFFKEKLPLQSLKNLLIDYSNLGDHQQRIWYTTNHDENSWNGTEYDKYGQWALAMAVFSSTWNGIPLLYSGQELPSRKKLAFFDKDPILWEGSFQLDVFYETLLHLKATHPALFGGSSTVHTFFVNTTENDKILAYCRKSNDYEVLVFLNFSTEILDYCIEDLRILGEYTEVFSKYKVDFSHKKSHSIASGGYAVFEK